MNKLPYLALAFLLISCSPSSITPTSSKNVPSDILSSVSENNANELDSLNLIGKAVLKSFVEESNSRLTPQRANEDSSIESDPLHYSYPFDSITIESGLEYHAWIDEIEGHEFDKLRDCCGFGDISVIISSFNVSLSGNSVAGDEMITFKGEKGSYSILSNSGANYPNISYTTYSSHKTLKDNAIDKDFTGPFYAATMLNDGKGGDVRLSFSYEKTHIAGYEENNPTFPCQYASELQEEHTYNVNELI